jgi:transcriptional regulator with XRE-family HTH domain
MHELGAADRAKRATRLWRKIAAARLRALRRACELSLAEAAQAVGLSVDEYRLIESGEAAAGVECLLALARRVGLPAWQCYGFLSRRAAQAPNPQEGRMDQLVAKACLAAAWEELQARGLGDTAVADRTGLPLERVRGLRRGEVQPTLAELEALAAAAGLSPAIWLAAVERRPERPALEAAGDSREQRVAELAAQVEDALAALECAVSLLRDLRQRLLPS